MKQSEGEINKLKKIRAGKKKSKVKIKKRCKTKRRLEE
jgi:hypothetical protein